MPTRRRMDHLPRSAIAGQATFVGCLARITIARHALRQLLPESIAFAESGGADHPCLLVFGEQRDGTTLFGGLPVPWGITYHELLFAVPFVRWRESAREHLFVSGMICDFWPAVWNGNFYYGFNKRFMRMSWHGDRFSVNDTSSRPSFTASIDRNVPTSRDALDWIRSAASLPVLGHRRDGVFVRSQFEWDFSKAVVEAAAVTFAPGRQIPDIPLPGSVVCVDAFRVARMCWRLTWPEPATFA